MAKRKRYKKVEQSLVDIIIPVHNRFDILEDCLAAIPDAFDDISYKIILVDNGSETLDAKNFYDQFVDDTNIIVTRNATNEGFPKACNKGFNKGSSPLVFFLNSDVIMENGSGVKLVKDLDDPTIGIAGMKLLFPSPEETMGAGLDMNIRPPQKVQHVGLVTNIRGEIIHAMIGWSSDNPRVENVRDVMAVTGAALMTRRELYRTVGGFDEIYGVGTFEDVDYCLKIRRIPKNVIVDTKAVGTHYVGATAEKYKQAFPLNKNYQIFISRWRENLMHTDWQVL